MPRSCLPVVARIDAERGNPGRYRHSAGHPRPGRAPPVVLAEFVWWKLVHVLGYINARIILTVLFTVLLVPIGLFWRVAGKDPLGRRRAGTGWSPYPGRYRDPKHYSRMY